ncbi:LysR family transcriptional regulator [Novosphingobium sp. P6W]|uniref:LysR family transcriptional regulator n=1 Tax=Novosphingobium sp. P6W TaxID=1609758 RepID=UPI0005C31688|nr:LysR family transcriptional regulator [Novosphingobium sp. P6W]AXB80301.1 LysR family transcriptional regulator [Novosphingobium sp. P6W]KIS31635.1 LysR family transcriptional regulator [Novosphingobium sp. P6W]
MDLRQLRYFVAVAETGNFHRAAERLNMSQPPLTVAIRKLEEGLGTSLFERSPRGVTLTAAGRASLDFARATLAQAQSFRDAVRDGASGERGRLKVGFVGSATFELLPRIIPEYRRQFPAVELVLEEATSTEIVRDLELSVLDVGLVRLPLMEAAEVDTQVVDPDELYAALPAGHRLAARSKVDLADLSDEPFVLQSRVSVLHSITVAACQKAGYVPRVAQQATQLSAVLSLVRSDLGVALVPSRASLSVPHGVRLLPLAKRVPIETGVAVPRGGTNPLARRFAQIAALR